MKVLLIGSGAVGLGIASCLLKSKCKVDFYARKETAELLQSEGFYREGIFGDEFHPPEKFKVYQDFEEINNDYDYIAICTKTNISSEIAKLINSHKSKLGKSLKLVLFQNGWGMNEPFEKYFDKSQIFNGVVITGFTRPKKNVVNITVHSNAVQIGNLSCHNQHEVTKLAEGIDSGGLPAKTTHEVGKYMWAKILYNVTLNPLGALFKVEYGKLAETEYTINIMSKIIKEIFEVMKLENHTTFWETPEEYQKSFLEKILPPTVEHRSSMLQDIEAGRKTEIDTLTGVIVHLGKKHNINTDTNETILNMIKFVEYQNFQK